MQQVGLNKGKARNALALSLVAAAIVLWNTVYLEKAIQKLKRVRGNRSEELLTYLSPLGWEHIKLTGDYVWRPDGGVRKTPQALAVDFS